MNLAGVETSCSPAERHTAFVGGEALGVRLRTGGAARSCRLSFQARIIPRLDKAAASLPHSKAPCGRFFRESHTALAFPAAFMPPELNRTFNCTPLSTHAGFHYLFYLRYGFIYKDAVRLEEG
jgi:hypothetical protein